MFQVFKQRFSFSVTQCLLLKYSGINGKPIKITATGWPNCQAVYEWSSKILLICFSIFLWGEMVGFCTSKGIGLDTVVSGSSACIYHMYLTAYLYADYAWICDKCDAFWITDYDEVRWNFIRGYFCSSALEQPKNSVKNLSGLGLFFRQC